MRATATLLASLAMALAAIGLAVAAPGGGHRSGSAQLLSAGGALRITNSHAGEALFTASGMRPGAGVSGTVRIGNGGEATGRFSVRRNGLDDTPGPNGGRLSEQLALVLFDITDVNAPVTVYAGPPAAFTSADIGVLAPGRHRDFLFAATLPRTAGNQLQGAGMSLGFEWRATAVATPTPAPTATPKPKRTPTPRPVPPPPPTPKGEALADALGLPPARACIRRLRINLRAPRGTLASATVKVKRKVKARVTGPAATVRVTLRRLPKGRFKVTVTVKASDGKTYTSTRTYRSCHKR